MIKTQLTSSKQTALKNAFYNASGSLSGEILNTLWNELPLTAKKSIENILNAKSKRITIELPDLFNE